MKTQQKETLVHQNDMFSLDVWSNVLVSDEVRDKRQYSSSSFGPCCTDGCQYCRPNCREKLDSSNYF